MAYEWAKLKYRTRFWLIVAMLVAIPIIDVVLGWLGSGKWDFMTHRQAYSFTRYPQSMVEYPARMAFLSGGTIGHVGQLLLIWPLPIYLMLLGADDAIQERKLGYQTAIDLRQSFRCTFSRRLLTMAGISSLVMTLSLGLNFALVNLLYHGGTYQLAYLKKISRWMGPWFALQGDHPQLTSVVYILVFAAVVGVCAAGCVAISYLFPDYRIAYPLAFGLWFLQMGAPNSITYVIQPFIEFGPAQIVPAVLTNLAVTAALIGLAWLVRSRDHV